MEIQPIKIMAGNENKMEIITWDEVTKMNFVVNMLQDGTEMEQELAVEALGWMGDQESVDNLSYALKHINPRVRQRAVFALAQVAQGEALDAIFGQMEDTDFQVRAAIAKALAESPYEEKSKIYQALRKYLKDPEGQVRYQAVMGIAKLSHPEVVPALVACLQDDSNNVRVAATQILGDIGDSHVEEALRPLVQEDNPDLAQEAFKAMQKIQIRRNCTSTIH